MARIQDTVYRAHVGTRAFDIAVRDGRLELDGTPVEYAFEKISDGCYGLLIDGRSVSAVVEPDGKGRLRVTIAGRQSIIRIQDETDLMLERFGMVEGAGAGTHDIHAPMPGLVLRVAAAPGQQVRAGDGLVVLEAMKMENELRAGADGRVKAVHVQPGDAVGKNALLIELEA